MFDETLFRGLLQRGAVFAWHRYDRLDDPNVAAKTKFIILINAFLPHDPDPLFYILTTSNPQKPERSPYPEDCIRVPEGTCEFFDKETYIDVSYAGTYALSLAEFRAMYRTGQVERLGELTEDWVRKIDRRIVDSRAVPPNMKRKVTAWT